MQDWGLRVGWICALDVVIRVSSQSSGFTERLRFADVSVAAESTARSEIQSHLLQLRPDRHESSDSAAAAAAGKLQPAVGRAISSQHVILLFLLIVVTSSPETINPRYYLFIPTQ